MTLRTTAHISLLLLLLLPALTQAAPRQYLAQLDRASWELQADDEACRLSHDIPFFGSAQISDGDTEGLQLRVFTDLPPGDGGIAEVFTRNPPHWEQPQERRLQTVRIHTDPEVFHFSRHNARRLLGELEQGRVVVFRFASWVHEGVAEVVVSNTGFRPARVRQLECLAELRQQRPEPPAAEPVAVPSALAAMGYSELTEAGEAPAHERQAEPHEILFDVATADLTPAARASLRSLAETLRHDSSWQRVVATAYSGSAGTDRYNHELAQRRAEAVQIYLAQLGVPSNRVQLRAFAAALAADEPSGEPEAHRRAVVAIN